MRAVYAFSLATQTLSAAPVFTLDRTRLDDDAPFKPSALAVHPATGEIYVLSSVRKALAVLGADGTLRAAVQLPADLYAQPEGHRVLARRHAVHLQRGSEWPRDPAPL